MISRTLFAALGFLILTFPARAEVNVQQVTSPGGIEAWLVEEPSIPFATLEIWIRGGASLDPEGQRGVSNLMVALIEEGSGDMDAQAFAKAQDLLATSFSYDIYDDTMSIGARFLTENRSEAIDLLRQSIHAPTFDQQAIDRVKAQVMSGIASSEKDPRDIASKEFYALSLGDHPYATDSSGTRESVDALTRADLVAQYKKLFTKDRMYVSAVGDINAQELGELLDNLLGDLPSDPAGTIPDIDLAFQGGVKVIDHPGPQSIAFFGHQGIDRLDPDFFPAYILNQILGSGTEARLMQEVREKRGLTYGISTSLITKEATNLYLGQFASANERIGEAIEVVQAEWAKIAEKGITQEELDAKKQFLTGAYALRFDGNARIASILTGMQMTGLTADYIQTRNDRINAVTLEDVNRVAKKLYTPDQLQFVVVGQPTGLTSQW